MSLGNPSMQSCCFSFLNFVGDGPQHFNVQLRKRTRLPVQACQSCQAPFTNTCEVRRGPLGYRARASVSLDVALMYIVGSTLSVMLVESSINAAERLSAKKVTQIGPIRRSSCRPRANQAPLTYVRQSTIVRNVIVIAVAFV